MSHSFHSQLYRPWNPSHQAGTFPEGSSGPLPASYDCAPSVDRFLDCRARGLTPRRTHLSLHSPWDTLRSRERLLRPPEAGGEGAGHPEGSGGCTTPPPIPVQSGVRGLETPRGPASPPPPTPNPCAPGLRSDAAQSLLHIVRVQRSSGPLRFCLQMVNYLVDRN